MKTIIAATDFSDVSYNAVNYAAGIANEIKVELFLLHVIEAPFTPLMMPLTETEFDEKEKTAWALLDEMERKLLSGKKDIINIHKEIKYGFVEVVLENLCRDKEPFAVVIGLKKANAVNQFFLGSTALRIMPNINYPVLIIPEGVMYNGIKKIVIASALQEEDASIPLIKRWLNLFHISPDIIHVNSGLKPNSENTEINIFLQNIFKEFNPAFHFINSEHIEDAVLNFIKEQHPDMLIVLPGKYGLLKNIFHKSHSKQLILQAHVPVLSIAEQKLPASKHKTNKPKPDHDCSKCTGACVGKKTAIKLV